MIPLTLLAVVAVGAVLFLHRLVQLCYSLWSVTKLQLRLPPSPFPSHLLLGHMTMLRDRARMISDEVVMQLVKVRPRLCRYRVGFGPKMFHVQVYHPSTVGPVLRSSMPKMKFLYDFIRPFIGDGLLISGGEKWSRDRRLLTPAFHFAILKPYTDVYVNAVDTFLDKIARQMEQENTDCVSVNVTEPITLLTLDVLLRCAMSYESNCQETGESEYALAVMHVTQLATERFRSMVHWSDAIFPLTAMGKEFKKGVNICHNFCRKVIHERRQKIDEIGELVLSKDRRYLDFLDILITAKDTNGQGLTDDEMLDQVGTFLFEGHDTTASAFQWTLFFLAENQDVQDQAREEAMAVIGSDDFKHEHMQKLPLITRCIKETLRLRPSVPNFGRELTEDMVVDGYRLPKGMEVIVASNVAHRHPEVWSDPLKFDPDRFLPERITNQHAYAFFPFSAGPRNCIGQTMAMDELRTMLSMSLLRYRFDPHPDCHNTVLEDAVILRARGGIPLKISRIF